MTENENTPADETPEDTATEGAPIEDGGIEDGGAEDSAEGGYTPEAKIITRENIHVAADDHDIRLDRWFKRHRPILPHALLARWLRTGKVRVDGARAAPDTRIEKGQLLTFPQISDDEARNPRQKARVPLSDDQIELARSMVIHQDEDAIVLNKLPGLATQGGTGTTAHVDGLLDAFHDERKGRPKLVHRLDKDTSGVLLVARSAGAASKFSRSFAGRSARKTYWAIITGVPSIDAGEIDLPLAKQPGSGGEKMHVDEENGQPSKTRYRVIERAGNTAAFVELQPLTGRTHQLRVHMAAIGHPIVGDGKYGGKEAFLTGTISRKLHLHARRLKIDHPGGGKLEVQAELPEHFAESLASLGFSEMSGDNLPLDMEDAAPAGAGKKAKALAHAKAYRKARRGERRRRGGDEGGSGGRGGGSGRGGSRGGGRKR